MDGVRLAPHRIRDLSLRRIPARDITLQLGVSVRLDEEAAHYVRDVLRLDLGTVVEVFDGRECAFQGPIESLDPLVVRLDTEVDATAMESPCRVTLYQAIPKKDRFEWLLEKATELGVATIVPIETARAVVRIPPAKRDDRRARWQRICDGAARQCGRSVSPVVEPIIKLEDAPAAHLCVVLDPRATATLAEIARDVVAIDVFVGPEGGFDDTERAWLAERAIPCRLGPRVLRSKTAGIAALTVIQAVTGGFD